MTLINFITEIQSLFSLVEKLHIAIESIEITDSNGNLIIIK
jgi:hypothetical protein